MTRSDLAVFIGGLLFIIAVVYLSRDHEPTVETPPRTIEYLRDSFEMEYYKKQLETYPIEHSKIPDTTVK